MNAKQAKRIRRAVRMYTVENAASLGESMSPHTLTAEQQANVYARQLHMMWPALNHKQRGAVSADLCGYVKRGSIWPAVKFPRPYKLTHAVRRAVAFVLSA